MISEWIKSKHYTLSYVAHKSNPKPKFCYDITITTPPYGIVTCMYFMLNTRRLQSHDFHTKRTGIASTKHEGYLVAIVVPTTTTIDTRNFGSFRTSTLFVGQVRLVRWTLFWRMYRNRIHSIDHTVLFERKKSIRIGMRLLFE